MDTQQFSDSLMTMADLVEDRVDAIIRKACIDLYRRIVERTPVDTGRAKGSWALSVYEGAEYELEEGEYSAAQISGMVNEHVSDFRTEVIGGQVIIYNNLEYINNLESGTSDQAPAGMVAVSLTEFEQFFNAAIAQLGGEIT